MNAHTTRTDDVRARRGERGAALITTLLVSTLLFAAGGSLVFSTMMSATNSMAGTPEQQAYYAAEAGLQAALNVLRGNVAANPALPGGRRVNFRSVITPDDSNNIAGGDNTGVPRLSRYLPYTNLARADSRVNLLANGTLSYSITLSEPPGIVTPVANEPDMLIVTSTGFGPRGARKRLQMMVRRLNLEIDPPAAIVLNGGAGINFNLGSSNSSIYSGLGTVPAIAVSPGNVGTAQTAVTNLNSSGSGTQVSPATVGQLGAGTPQPAWLQTPDSARAFLQGVKSLAYDEGRLFSTQNDVVGGMGAPGSPKVTYIDNYNGPAVSLGPGLVGVGLLVVTGNIETSGRTSFDGIILAMGRGSIQRDGGGSGEINGAVIVSCFDPNDPNADTFCGPTFTVNGGGNLTMRFDPAAIAEALRATGRSVVGVVEN